LQIRASEGIPTKVRISTSQWIAGQARNDDTLFLEAPINIFVTFVAVIKNNTQLIFRKKKITWL
jgi:hypothetical protein